ncbi:MAG: histidinol-phosphatase HisJ family protein [Armatimonadota bacterium]
MLASYHVHSRWSDGKADVVDYIRAAGEMGLDEIGISDHYVLTPNGEPQYFSMDLNCLDDYVEDVQNSAGEAPEGLIVRLGLEVDYFPETENLIKDILASYPFDYVIGSIHFVNGFPIDDAVEPWEKLNQDERNDAIECYWVRMRQMAESGLFDFAGHLDLTKKFGFYSTRDISGDISAALDAIAKSDMAFEVNTSGWYKPCKEVYPSPEIIKGCFDRGIPVVVTADAHLPEHIIRRFDEGYSLIKEIGYTQTASYAGRMRIMEDI